MDSFVFVQVHERCEEVVGGMWLHNPGRNVTLALCCLFSFQRFGRSLELKCV